MDRFVVISGCSGGGKSSLLLELRRRGHSVVEEPGLRIVKEERKSNGTALPWVDAAAFLRRAIEMAIADRVKAAKLAGWVFFDRGLVDAASGLQFLTGTPVLQQMGATYRYHHRVFLAPPWPEIFAEDEDRRHSLESAIAEYERLFEAYTSLGYQIALLPKVSVSERADLVRTILDV
jgi:predicted ATPase